jgi:hypothetical protein
MLKPTIARLCFQFESLLLRYLPEIVKLGQAFQVMCRS